MVYQYHEASRAVTVASQPILMELRAVRKPHPKQVGVRTLAASAAGMKHEILDLEKAV
jgi:hypothetical protein